MNALAFAEAGIPIFPVRMFQDGERWRKRPFIRDWPNRASADSEIVAEWWRQWPDAVPGIALAHYGRVVVDADRHAGKPDGVSALEGLGPLPPHPIVRTASGGEHHYFTQPSPPIAASDALAHLGIDVLGTSRFVVGYSLAPLLALPAPPLPEVFRRRKVLIHSADRLERNPADRLETPRVVWPDGGKGKRAVVSHHSREGRYAWAALCNAFEKLSGWPKVKDSRGEWRRPAGRNNLLNKLAFKMGGLVANGWIDDALVVRVLMHGAAECWLLREDGEEQCLATICSGLSAGMQLPYPPLEPFPGAAHTPLGVSYQKPTKTNRLDQGECK